MYLKASNLNFYFLSKSGRTALGDGLDELKLALETVEARTHICFLVRKSE